MTESHRGSESPNRFDWGPPSGKVSESLKEWLVYPILLVLVLGAGWFLLDLDHQRIPASSGGGLSPAGGGTHTDDFRSRPDSRLRGSPGSGWEGSGTTRNTAQGTTRNTAQGAGSDALSGGLSGAEPAAVPGRSLFFVQLGAFAEEDSAQEAFQRALKAGFPASMAVPDEQYDMYRLLMGPYANEQEAEQNSRKLQDLDFPSFVIESM